MALLSAKSGLAAQSPASGDFAGQVDVGGGRHVYIHCGGNGQPAVVFVSGYRVRADYWSYNNAKPAKTSAFPGVARFTHACAYDRPGTVIGTAVADRSRSDTVPMPRSAMSAVDELHALIRAAHITRPVVIVGHSLGGLLTLLYAYKYPSDVAGLVLVDALVDTRSGLTPAEYQTFVRLNVDRPKELDAYKGYEVIPFAPAFTALYKLQAAAKLRPMPVVVITRGLPVNLPPTGVPPGFSRDLERVWRVQQNKLVKLVPGARQIIARTSEHYVMLTQPDVVIAAARQVVDAVRRGEHRVP